MGFQFKIQLLDVDDPIVWRRLIVPERFTFMRFHRVIQRAFGWKESHLFQFSPEGWDSEPHIGLHIPEDFDEDVQDCKKVKLSQIFVEPSQTYTYIYDFGDNWQHLVVLEAITGEILQKADCIDGGGKCPPEDCGGVSGYKRLKEIVADPGHPEYYEMKDWLGLSTRKKWNTYEFDLKKIQSAVRRQ